jgi:hypothetical protein
MPTPRKYQTNAERQAAYRMRRMAIPAAVTPPPGAGYRRWAGLLGQIHAGLATLTEEMAAYWDLRSERWQESERGEQFAERLDALEALRDQVEEWVEA